MRKILFFAFLLLCGNLMAEEENKGTFSINFSIRPGETLKDVPVNVEWSENFTYVAFQMFMKLPEGITVVQDVDDDLGPYLNTDRITVKRNSYSHTLSCGNKNGCVTFGAVSLQTTNNDFKSNTGAMLYLTVTAAEDMTPGTYNIELSELELTLPDATAQRIDNTTCTITVIDPTATAISTVSTEQENAPAYNLKGQRVDNGYRGIVVKSGRKFVSK